MKRNQIACYLLLASALAMTAVLVGMLNQRVAPAQAEMVLARNNLTLMTARTADDEEALFVVDNLSQKLLVYTSSIRGGRAEIELKAVEDLAVRFGTQTGGGSSSNRGR